MKSIASLLLTLSVLLPPPQQPPPRDTRQPAPRTGTGVIRGRVLAADTGLPIRRAVVTINAVPSSTGMSQGGPMPFVVGGQTSPVRAVHSDDSGTFVFAGLPEAGYRLSASPGQSRAQYLSMRYGARDPMQMGTTVALADGQRLDNLDILLPRAAVITGRVTDDGGDPLARVMVYTLQRRGGQVSRTGPSAMSDDLGQFRIFGLPPGDYIVAADSRAGGGGPPVEGDSLGFVTTYGPGTANPSEALRLRVAAGAEATADIRMIRSRLFRISGSIVNARGEAVTRVSLQLARRDPFGQFMGTGASVDPQGRFVARDLAPGEYRILARQMPAVMGSGPGAGNTPRDMATATVQVDQADVENVLLVLQPGVALAGTIVYETPPATDIRVRVMAQPADRLSGMTGPPSNVEVTGAETFTLQNLFGPTLVRASAQSQGWSLKAVLLRGRDITDVPTEFTAQDSGRLQIVMTTRAPSLEGIVAGADGQPVRDGGVVLAFGEDPATWVTGSSMIRSAGILPEGTFRMPGLREGQYYVVALPRERMPNTGEPSRELFEALIKEATAVTVAADEQRKVDLRMSRGDGG